MRATIGNQSMDAPGGVVFLDPETQHTWKPVRIGQINAQGQFDIVWDSDKPVRPVPYPIYRPAANWDQFLQDLYSGWGNNWAAPTSIESP